MKKDERLSVQVTFISPSEGKVTMSSVAFGWDEAQAKRQQMIADLKAEGVKPFDSKIVPDKPDENRSAFHGL